MSIFSGRLVDLMSGLDYIILGGIVFAAAGIAASMIRKRRRGERGCGNCARCADCWKK